LGLSFENGRLSVRGDGGAQLAFGGGAVNVGGLNNQLGRVRVQPLEVFILGKQLGGNAINLASAFHPGVGVRSGAVASVVSGDCSQYIDLKVFLDGVNGRSRHIRQSVKVTLLVQVLDFKLH